MINFKQYLTEARSAPLYHGCSMDTLYLIFRSHGLERRTSQTIKKLILPKESKTAKKYSYMGKFSSGLALGVSLTRNIRFAKYWTQNKGAVLEFDQAELIKRHKIIPMQYWDFGQARSKGHIQKLDDTFLQPHFNVTGDHTNEYEEFLLLKPEQTLSTKYITHIHIPKEQEETLLFLMNRHGEYHTYSTF